MIRRICLSALVLTTFLQASPALLEVTAPTPIAVHASATGTLELATAAGPLLTGCRAYLASRPAGGGEWHEEFSPYKLVSEENGRLTLTASFEQAQAAVTIQPDASGRLTISGNLRSTATTALEIARFHFLDGSVAQPSLNLLSMRQYELPGRIFKPGETLPAPIKKGWGWQRLVDPIHARPNTAISGDSGMLAPDWNSPGLFFGFTGPGSAFGEGGIRTANAATSFFLAVLLDAITLDPGKSRVLEQAVVSFGDPQDELRHWLVACRDTLGPARVRPPLVGYCSWYQMGQRVQPDDIRRALRTFESYPAPPGGRTIQIDDGYQVSPGDWSGRNEWKDALKGMAVEIKAKGFVPGIWVAPTAIHASHPIVKEHPEWLQRDAKGDFCIRFHNWKSFNGMTGADTYFLEPDHPGAREFIRSELQKLRAMGWDYFKIDFAYTVSSDRAKYDPRKTTYESLHDQWKLFREALGGDALINSCNGGIWRYSIGQVDISRAGGDIGGNIKSLRRNLAEMMLRSPANGVWFQVDPDVFYMRQERSSLNFEQSRLLTETQGLLGTAFLTSDFADQWTPAAADVVKTYWNAQGPRVPAMTRLRLTADGLPAALAVAYGAGDYAVALYNWSTEAGDVSVRLADLRVPAAVTVAGSGPGVLQDGAITIHSQPAESIRIVKLKAVSP